MGGCPLVHCHENGPGGVHIGDSDQMSMIDSDRGERGGTWGSSEAAAEWMRGAAARVQPFGPATERMLDLANIRSGNQVLDVGAGAGDQTLAAARRVGPTGFVLATDISASMLGVTAMSARQAELSNVGTRVMDAQNLDLESDSFDAVISCDALMLIPDIRKALAEMQRVLRLGGTVAAIVFSTPEKCPYLSIPHTIARRVGALTTPSDPFGEFRLAGPDVLSDACSKAGFHEVAIHRFLTRRRFPSLADAMQYAKGPLPLRELMAQLTPVQREQAWAEIEKALQQFVGPDGYDSPCELLIGVGTK